MKPRMLKSARFAAIASLISAGAAGQDLKFPARHDHLRGGGSGVLAFTNEGVEFEESGKKSEHSRRWSYADLHRFVLGPTFIRITTYDDVRWQLGRDREYRFDEIPDGIAQQLYAALGGRLDQRFVAEIATVPSALWTAPAKMLRGTSGSNGVLTIGGESIAFESEHRSRTWRYSDVAGLSNAGPLELSITSLDGETRFQLKQIMPEEQYNTLWRRISEANGLRTFHSQMETKHE